MTTFEKEVRKKLIDKEMSIPEFAKELKISPTYLYDILNGARRGDILKIKIVSLLGLPSTILKGEE